MRRRNRVRTLNGQRGCRRRNDLEAPRRHGRRPGRPRGAHVMSAGGCGGNQRGGGGKAETAPHCAVSCGRISVVRRRRHQLLMSIARRRLPAAAARPSPGTARAADALAAPLGASASPVLFSTATIMSARSVPDRRARSASEQLAAEGPDTPAGRPASLRLFGTHIGGGSQGSPPASVPPSPWNQLQGSRTRRVGSRNAAGPKSTPSRGRGADLDVGRLQIAMNDALLVRG